jgi:DNA-binding GntR family transcriptional regulator
MCAYEGRLDVVLGQDGTSETASVNGQPGEDGGPAAISVAARITPVPRSAGDHAAVAVHAHLRSLILGGVIPPGAQLNQVELAPLLGVSRTPLREAIRMLQEEGLVDAQPQKRARIIGFDPGHLEAVYAQRVLLEGLGAMVTAATITDEALDELSAHLGRMREAAGVGEAREWRVHHRLFHLGLVGGMGSHMLRAIDGHMDRSAHYRQILEDTSPSWFSAAADAEHEEILRAFVRRDGVAAAAILTTHLARMALSLIAQLAPAYDPIAIRTALGAYNGSPPVR